MLVNNNARLINLQFFLYKIVMNIQALTSGMYDTSRLTGEVAKLPSESARMAICILAVGPIIFAYPFFQKYFIKGLTIGAVKG